MCSNLIVLPSSPVTRVAASSRAFGAQGGLQHGVDQGHADAGLLELLRAGALAGLARFGDVYLLGGDADIARRGHDV